LLLLRVLKDLKKPLGPDEPSRVNGGGGACSTFSSSISSEIDSTRRMSEQLCIVVEQLIWPPKKKATLPSALNKGAGLSVSGQCRHYVASLQSKWLTDV